MSPWRTVGFRTVKLAGLALVVASCARSDAQKAIQQQVLVQAGNANAPENADARDSNEGVVAPESTNAMDQLALAQKMERLKEWTNSADLYQEILTNPQYAAKVVPSKQDADHKIYQYSSVEERVMQRLSRWPQEGLQVYSARYEAPAQTLLESAKPEDLFTLQQVFTRYFVTTAGKTAAIRLIDHYLETGEFRAAASIGDRLLQWHPSILADRAGLLYRMAIAYHLSGDDVEAKHCADELKKHDPQAKGIVRGKDVVLADSLAAELAQPAPTSLGSTADSFNTFGGDVTRNRILAVTGTPGAHLYSIALSKPSRLTGPQSQNIDARHKEDVKNGMTLGVMPVVDRGELFFQDGERVYGLNLESGVPLPGWQQSHGADHDGAYTLPNVQGSPRTHQLTLTLTDHAVLAVMGQTDPELARNGIQPQGETRLVCLDRMTGKENWVVAPSELKPASLKAILFAGAPLVIGDNVVLVGTASKQPGFEACWVVCFDLNNGTLRWSSNVASASTVAAAWQGINPNFAMPQNESHLAYANGRLYVQTNRGAVAAVDAYNGNISWLDIYPRGQQAMMNPQFNPMFFQPGQVPTNQNKPWAFNPVIASQGMVFTLPIEGKFLLIYDAASGTEIKRIDRADLAQKVKSQDVVEHDDFDTLAGVIGDKLILVGNHTVVALNWKTYDADHYDDGTMLFWDAGFAQPLRGRPFVTATRLFLPMEDHLYQLDLKSGKAVEEYPKYPRVWDEDEGPGNVLVTSDHMVIATAERVDVFTDLAAAKAKLDRQVAEAPNDPQPRLRYAEVMYAAGDYDTSVTKLDEAITRVGGLDAMQPGPARDRVFNDSLTFAQKLRADDHPETRAREEMLFDRAAKAALSPDQKVQYCLGRARFNQIKNDPPAALKLYQQILSDPSMRSVPLPDETSSAPTSADVVARKQIAELIKADPKIYDSVEQEAVAALQKAQDSKDPAQLLEVARAYPNSSSSTKATLAAADAYEAAGDVHAARHVLSDIYFDRNDKAPEWPQILEAMARTDVRTAAHMLAQGAEKLHDAKLTKPLKLADGTVIPADTSFADALEKARKSSDREQARVLPTFKLPNPQDFPAAKYPKPFLASAAVILNVDALASPLNDFARPDRLVTWSSAPLLSVYHAGADSPSATSNQLTEPVIGSAWLDKDLLVWSATQVVLLHNEGADVGWKMDVSKLATIEVVAADRPQETLPVPVNGIRGNRVFINRARGGQVNIRNGVIVPAGIGVGAAAPKPVPAGPEQIDQVLPVGDRVLISTTAGRLMSLETAHGGLAWQTRLTDRPLDRLVADEDFTAVKAEDDLNVRLAVLDTYTGHVRGTRTFTRESNAYPQNLALSPDGTLVYTLPDRICVKDLYKPWETKAIEKQLPTGQANFSGLTEPDQLVISEGRILALIDTGTGDRGGEKFVRLYSLQTGDPIMVPFAQGSQVEQALSIGSKSPDVSLRVIGPRVYVIAPDAAIFYNLDNPDDKCPLFDEQSEGMGDQLGFIGQDYLVLLNPKTADGNAVAANPPPAGAVAAQPPALNPAYTLYAFSRATFKGRETGRLDYNTTISDSTGITGSWQAMDGGLAFVTGDHKLHYLLGAK